MNINQSLQQCQICFPNSQKGIEIGIILKNLLNLMNKQIEKGLGQRLDYNKNHSNFYQLLKCIFENKNNLSKNVWKCNHSLLSQYFSKKIHISIQQLEILSEYFLRKIMKRRYQIEVIKALTKNMPKTILKKNTKQKKYIEKNSKISVKISLQHNNKANCVKNNYLKQMHQTTNNNFSQIQKYSIFQQSTDQLNKNKNFQFFQFPLEYKLYCDQSIVNNDLNQYSFPFIRPEMWTFNQPQFYHYENYNDQNNKMV